jgi:uncharacterized membrane protein YfcA
MFQITLLALVGLFGGMLGAVVGLGGGVFIIPALTLFLDVPIHNAIPASLVGVIATSTSGSIRYVREELANVRLGMTMETGLTLGALVGGVVAAGLSNQVLSAVFGGVMVVVSIYIGLSRRSSPQAPPPGATLGMYGASYYDAHLGHVVRYRVRRLPLGLLASLIAGSMSGLLGVGGGFMTVPVMCLGMDVPMRAATATSSFMLGVTACAGAIVYFGRGLVDPVVTVPVVLGVVVGALAGSRLAVRVRTSVLTVVLAVVLFVLSVQMIFTAAGISLR